MEIKAGFVQQQNRTIGFAVFCVRRKHDVEREEPLETTASFIKVYFNVIRAVGIGNQRIEVLRV